MSDIDHFILVRQDGREIREDMSLTDVSRLGWPVAPIVAATWRHSGQSVTVPVTPGSLAQVVAGRHYVAIIKRQSGKMPPKLLIVGADGGIGREIPNLQIINGREATVEFQWFEKPVAAGQNILGVVVYLARGVTYQLDVDVASGEVFHAKETR